MNLTLGDVIKLADRYEIIYITSGFAESLRNGEEVIGFPHLKCGDYMGEHFPQEIVERIYNF